MTYWHEFPPWLTSSLLHLLRTTFLPNMAFKSAAEDAVRSYKLETVSHLFM